MCVRERVRCVSVVSVIVVSGLVASAVCGKPGRFECEVRLTTPLLKANNTSEREERLLTGVWSSGDDVQRADSRTHSVL